jgi:DNA primase
METPEDQANVQRTILSSIGKIPDALVRESYIKLASEAMNIPDLQLRQVLRDLQSSLNRKRSAKAGSTRGIDRSDQQSVGFSDHESSTFQNSRGSRATTDPVVPNPPKSKSAEEVILPAEKTLFGIMLRDGSPLVEFIMSKLAITDFSEGASREMATRIISMYEEGAIEVDGFIEGKYGDSLRRLSTEVLTHNIEPSENWSKKKNINVPALNEEAKESAASAMTLLKLDRIDIAIKEQKERMFRAQEDPETTRLLAEEMIALNEMRKMIKERKFINGV